MKISGYKSTVSQSYLWPVPINSLGQCRTVIGDLAEELAVRYHGARRHKTDSRAEYCPDLSMPNGYYAECKAVGKSGQLFIYEGRYKKDCNFVAEGNPLLYMVWKHNAVTKDCGTVDELRNRVISSIQNVYLIPFRDLRAIVNTCKPVRLNSHYGNSDTNPVYGSGYRMPLSQFEEFAVGF